MDESQFVDETSILFSSTTARPGESEMNTSLGLLDNLMTSIESQHGEPGPATTLFQSIGLNWPVDIDSSPGNSDQDNSSDT